MMKRRSFFLTTGIVFAITLLGCSTEKESSTTIIGGADGPTSIYLAPKAGGNVEDAASSVPVPLITGTWQTASIGYEDGGTMYPEYYVQFTDTEINYGHMKDGEFELDHSDRICLMEQTADGECRVQAESANGTHYTYQTSESDKDVLEYYETWNEDEFPDMYRGGASLSRSH